MTDWPAFCSNCGASFSSGISVDPGIKNLKIINTTSVCPKCMAPAKVLDGGTDNQGNVYFLRAAYKALTALQVSTEDLFVISNVIKQAQQKREEPKYVIGELEKKVPSASSLIELLKPKTANEFYVMLSFILALIIYIQSQTEKADHLPQQVINNISINQTYINPEPQKITKKQPIGNVTKKKDKENNRKLMQKKSRNKNRKR
ncbi:hypothetical protein [Nitrospira sp. Ecomares 2.1]